MKRLGAGCGAIVTASHNPKEYNGFKAYNDLGGQVVEPWDAEVEAHMAGLPLVPEPPVVPAGRIQPIPAEVEEAYLAMGLDLLQQPEGLRGRPHPLHALPWHGHGLRARTLQAGRPAPHRQPQPGHAGRHLPHGPAPQPRGAGGLRRPSEGGRGHGRRGHPRQRSRRGPHRRRRQAERGLGAHVRQRSGRPHPGLPLHPEGPQGRRGQHGGHLRLHGRGGPAPWPARGLDAHGVQEHRRVHGSPGGAG